MFFKYKAVIQQFILGVALLYFVSPLPWLSITVVLVIVVSLILIEGEVSAAHGYVAGQLNILKDEEDDTKPPTMH